jgi:hypothetical protein
MVEGKVAVSSFFTTQGDPPPSNQIRWPQIVVSLIGPNGPTERGGEGALTVLLARDPSRCTRE